MGVEHPPIPGLRSIAHLGVSPIAFTHRLHEREVPDETVRVALSSPAGQKTWTWGPPRQRTAITLGADLAYLGTRFLASAESMAPRGHKDMVAESTLDDVVLTSAVTGLPTNMLRPSLQAYGVDIAALQQAGPNARIATLLADDGGKPRNWLDLWSAGHSISGVRDIPTVAELTERLIGEYQPAYRPRERENAIDRVTDDAGRGAKILSK